jgi:hypothetical protein
VYVCILSHESNGFLTPGAGAGTTYWEIISGPTGSTGPTGVPVGGATGSVLTKLSGTNYDVAWVAGYRYAGQTVYTSSSTFNKSNVQIAYKATAIRVRVVGAGGGGGGAATTGAGQTAIAGAGGGGGYSEKFILLSALGATETITVGTGGSGGAAGNNNGVAGGKSSFYVNGVETVIGNGGSLGTGSGVLSSTVRFGSAVGAGGTATGGDINLSGSRASRGFSADSTCAMFSEYGGGSALSPSSNLQATNSGSAGIAGQVYGQGGGGGANSASQVNRAGGAGAAGIVIIDYYC